MISCGVVAWFKKSKPILGRPVSIEYIIGSDGRLTKKHWDTSVDETNATEF